MKQLLTHTRMSSFRACPRRHYLRYELGLSRIEKTQSLNIGRIFHSLLDATHKGVTPELDENTSLYNLAVTAAMIEIYDTHYADSPLNIVASELAFELPLLHFRTGRPSIVWNWAGVIDGIAELEGGRLALIERKTTSRDITPGGDYWANVMRDQQISQYINAAEDLGYPISTVLYDVVRRPMHQPRMATPREKWRYKKDGSLYANIRTEDETPQDYAARMTELIGSDPEKHFQRIEIPRTSRELDTAAEDQWMLQRMIRRSQRTGEWPRNPHACLGPPFRCRFVEICDNVDLETNTPEGYERLEDVHPELPKPLELELSK